MTKGTIITSTVGTLIVAGIVGVGAMTARNDHKPDTVKSSTSKSATSESQEKAQATSEPEPAQKLPVKGETKAVTPKITTLGQAVFVSTHLPQLSHQAGTATVVLNDVLGHGATPVTIKLPKTVSYEMVTEMTPSPSVSGQLVQYKFDSVKDAEAYTMPTSDTDTSIYTKVSDTEYIRFSDVHMTFMKGEYQQYLNNEKFTDGATEVN